MRREIIKDTERFLKSERSLKKQLSTSARKAEEFTPDNCRCVLHLSDLHFMCDTIPENHLHSLAKDLESLDVEKLDVVVISGDFKDKADVDGFDKAKEFILALCSKFSVNPQEGLVIVPGNHDVQDLDESYDTVRKRPKDIPEHHVYLQGDLFEVRNKTIHRQRFKPFSQRLYRPLVGSAFPLDPAKQGFVKTFPELGLQFLLLNSAWELDKFARDNANILPEALLAALAKADEEMKEANNDLLRIGVWHHAIHTDSDGDKLKNPAVLCEHLQKHGFKVGLHGDVHKPENHLIGYVFPETSLHIVGAGSFSSPDSGIAHATPRLYNLLLFKEDRSAMRVHTRAQETVDGGWDAWAKWPKSGSDGKYGYYDISFD